MDIDVTILLKLEFLEAINLRDVLQEVLDKNKVEEFDLSDTQKKLVNQLLTSFSVRGLR